MEVGLVRVSTDRQSQLLQVEALTKAGVQRIFEETVSGTSKDRPGLRQALEFMRGGDRLTVYSISRLGRSVPDLLASVAELDRRGIALRSLTEQIDTTTPMGRLTFTIFSAVAQAEVEMLRERTRHGLEAAKAKGRIGGRPRKLGPDDLRAAKAMLVNQDISVREVAERLGVGAATLYRAMPAARANSQQCS